ncbi:MAG: glycoside hydrolase family 43 protein [Chthoniobacteraceae bacterium]
MQIHNPVIKGFNPDPSILRVGNDYYIATSTFEWFPCIQIHHSRDLVHWHLIAHALTSHQQADLLGVGDSNGVWAPSLSWHDGLFYLAYSIVRTSGMGRPFKDVHNYFVTAPSIHGPWSAPTFLNSSGFDPSLFHDDDGRKWVVNVQWDYRKNHPRFGGIVLQEYDPAAGRMTGPITTILQKNILIEGPNLYKRAGKYYLMLAEGGTGWNHGISMARASKIDGPYEIDPQPAVLTSRNDPSFELQKVGHGELVETPQGEWYLAHLCSRPVGEKRRCILGRETALQKVRWTPEGWLELVSGTANPEPVIASPCGVEETPWPAEPDRDSFDAPSLSLHWASLRIPADALWANLTERPGWLRLRGRESLHSLHEQSLLVKRLESVHCTVETCMEFAPTRFTQSAGLILYYDTKGHYYLRVTHDEACGKRLGIVLTDDGSYDELVESQISVETWPRCYLRAELDGTRLQFAASPDGAAWQNIGPELDASKLSDDYGTGYLRFTGTMAGLCAQDLGGTRAPADFDYFEIRNR